MDKKVFKNSELPVRRTSELLPETFKSSSNEKFLNATLDALTQPGSLDRISGYIGRQYGKNYNSKDVYIDVEKSLRSVYKLEPAVVTTNDSDVVTRYYDYIDLKNQLKFFNNLNEKDYESTGIKSYVWSPPVDWDKFINYREYYWLPQGPDTVSVAGQTEAVVSEYRVRSQSETEYLFFPDGLTPNPSITLYRGQTYIFNVNTPGDPLFIRTNRLDGAQANYSRGVENNGVEVGTLTFTVPLNAPDSLYYQSGNNINKVGIFRVANIADNTSIDVEKEIIGKVSYKSSNNVEFTNGLKVAFTGAVTPEKYSRGEWLVEGVGKSIKLISFQDLDLPPIKNDDIDVLFDDGGFDDLPFDDAVAYPTQKDYLTIKRSSVDRNPWSRYNKWFHKSVIEYSAQLNGVSSALAETSRAKRPIIEFNENIKLYNHCEVAKQSVDFIDDFTTDVFSTIEGSSGYNIDNIDIFDGARILFTADNDVTVKNKIFVVKFITIQGNNDTNKQVALVEADDTVTQEGEGVIVRFGKNNAGLMYHYDGDTWIKSQLKTSVNQAPHFDVFDNNLVSFADEVIYPTSSFVGSKIISYRQGTGSVDSELGFPIAYQNIANSGDILFNFDWDTETFTYQVNEINSTKKVSTGYLKIIESLGNWRYINNFIEQNPAYDQPVVDIYTMPEAGSRVVFESIEWDEDTRNELFFYLNGNKISQQYTIIDTVAGKRTFEFPLTFAQGDVITIKLYTDATPNLGYYEFPMNLERNPLNQDIETFTLGEANDHLRTMVELTGEFSGEFPGNSNLRDIVDYEQNGRRFVKHAGISSVALPLLIDKKSNIVKALRHASNQYENYKAKFISLATELPFDGENVVDYVDEIISKISATKADSAPFNNSDMMGSGAYNSIDYVVEDEGITTFALSEKFELKGQSTKAVYVYINSNQLINGVDYNFDSEFGFVRISKPLVEGDTIQIREYYSTSYNFIPETPTSMGLYKKYIPEIYIDDSYSQPTKVIRGHDGSVTVAFNDYRDLLILEFEKRIYNNIKFEYYEPLLDVDRLISGYHASGIFNKTLVDNILELEFLRWPSIKNINLYANTFYDGENPFTWTYNKVVDQNTRQEKMPQFWRGIYMYLYDTYTPNTTPWEMLGFSIKPTWWEEEYGPAPYTKDNTILWSDLQEGIIKQGSRQGQHLRYARPGLLNSIPVDSQGRLISPIENTGVVDFSNTYEGDFKFGDIAPVEHAWRRSSAYPYAKMIVCAVLRPMETLALNGDRRSLKHNLLNQIVSTSTDRFINKNDLIESITDDSKAIGFTSYIVNYLKFLNLNKNELVDIYENIDVRLSSRISGFVDKAQQKYLLDSKNPQSKQTGIFIPPEDYQIYFNTSAPTKVIKYSGVVVEKTLGVFQIKGYDQLDGTFNYFDYYVKQTDPVLNVGGVSEEFVDWTEEKFYAKSTICRYKNKFYRATETHTSGPNFESIYWVDLPSLPLIGGAEAIRRTAWNTGSPKRLSYGHTFNTVQEVVDFLLGYGEYLKSQGVVFDVYNQELAVTLDWEASAKEFMFWTTHNWAEGSLIALSPAATLLKVENVGSVAESLLDSFYDYTIFKSDGLKLDSTEINTYRGINEFYITPVDENNGIFFAKITYIQKEHVVVFNDKTIFNDVIYNKGPGYRQERIKTIGFRTTDWDGDYTSPGFLYDNVNIQPWTQYTDYRLGDIVSYKQYNYVSLRNQKGTSTFNDSNWEILDSEPVSGLVPNFDFRVNQFEDYYDFDVAGINSEQKILAKHTVGYQDREYLQEIAEDEVSQFRIYQGFIREKGTSNAITKIFDKVSEIPEDKIVLNEEWAIRLGLLGGTDQINELEFDLNASDFKLNPQPVVINGTGLSKEDSQNTIVLTENDFSKGDATFKFPTKFEKIDSYGAGYIISDDVRFALKTLDDVLDNTIDIDQLNDGDLFWTTFEVGGWNVYRYEVSNIIIVDVKVAENASFITLITNVVHNLQPGQIFGITNIDNLTGFFRVSSVAPKIINIDIAGYSQDPEIADSTFAVISVFTSVNLNKTTDIIDKEFARLPSKSKVFVDNYQEDKWAVLERNKQYVSTEISEYGIAFPTGTGAAVTFIEKFNQTIVGNPGAVVTGGDVVRNSAAVVYSQGAEGLIPLQILTPNSNIADNYLGSYATTLKASNDGRWLIVGSPGASYIPSNYQETFNPNKKYNVGDTVLFAGKLWEATNLVIGDGSTINLTSQDWKPVELHKVNPLGEQILDTNRGYRNMGAVDIFEYTNGQWILNESIISPRPAHGEYFGTSISIGKKEGIEGTSGDVTLTVKEIDDTGGIIEVSAAGTSGLNDEVFEGVSGVDISENGVGATFDVRRTAQTFVTTVRSGGSGYVVGDRLKIQGNRIGGNTPLNDLIITVTKVTGNGEILGSETYTNITGINNSPKEVEAVFTITKVRDEYGTPQIIERGKGYTARSIVRFQNRLFGCIQDTNFDKGVWDENTTYYPGDVIKYPARSTSYYTVLNEVKGIAPPNTLYYETYRALLPTTATDYWQPVSGPGFADLAVDWVEKDSRGTLIPYTAGSTILVPGDQLGGSTPENDLIIRVNSLRTFLDEQSRTVRTTEIALISFEGTAASGISTTYDTATVPSGEQTYNDITAEDFSQPGKGSIFNVTRRNGNYSATVAVSGTGYAVGDQIRVLGTELGAVDESYYMVITAPGSRDDRGRAYIYNYDGISWKHLEDFNFLGIYNYNLEYQQDTIVWFNNAYWKATEYHIGDGSKTPADGGWEEVVSVNTGMLPNEVAYENDGSTQIIDDYNDPVEFLNNGDQYGTSSDMSVDGTKLVISAPYSDTSGFDNYKGSWRSTEVYYAGDVVNYRDIYYRLSIDSSGTSTNNVPTVTDPEWEVVSQSIFKSGSIFVYTRSDLGKYELIQTIDASNVSNIETGDQLGYRVKLSDDGNELFITAPNGDVDELDQGFVLYYTLTNGQYTFVQRLQNLQTEFNQRFGTTIDISPDGQTLAIAAEGAKSYRYTTFDGDETRFDRFVTIFADPQGTTGKVTVYNKYDGLWVLGEVFAENLNVNEDFGRSLHVSNNEIIVGSPRYLSEDPAFQEVRIGRIQKFNKQNGVLPWTVIRQQQQVVDIEKIRRLSLLETDSYIKIADIDIIDPFKGKVLSIVEQNIDYKVPFDPAVYTKATNANATQDESNDWALNNIGKVWWDTSTIKYAFYEQGSLTYRLGNWGGQAVGSSIDVYEWIESKYQPSKYLEVSNSINGFSEGVTGTPLYPDNTAYSERRFVDETTGSTSRVRYYFWVKNRTNKSNSSTKTLTVDEMRDYIENPYNSGIPFAALINSDQMALFNVIPSLSTDTFSVNLQFFKSSRDINEIHREYELISEGTGQNPNEEIERKWIDSLVGQDTQGNFVPDTTLNENNRYGILSRPRQTMFVNRNKAVEITLDFINNAMATLPLAEDISYDTLSSVDAKPSIVTKLYDLEIETEASLRLISTGSLRPAVLRANVINGHINTVDIVDSGYGYRKSPKITINGSGTGAELEAVIDNFGRITSVTVVSAGKRYVSAQLIVRPFSVLVTRDSSVSGFWSIYGWNEKSKEFYRLSTQTYDTSKYWEKIDWWAEGISEKSRITATLPGLYAEQELVLEIGNLLRLQDYGSGGWAVLQRVNEVDSNILGKYKLVGRELGTLRIINKFYNTEQESVGYDQTQTYDSNKYDTSAATEFRNILKAVKEDIFVDELSGYWNKLFFVNLHYIFSEQVYVDWAFKTSFINATHNVGYLKQKLNYKSDNLAAYQKYIEEVKPYHTKIRKYTSRYFNIEDSLNNVSDFDLQPRYDITTNKIVPVNIGDPEIDVYPRKNWFDNYKYEVVELKISSVGSTYTSAPQVLFTGGGGTGASAIAYISNGKISSIKLISGGSGYTSAPIVELVGGVGTNLQNAGKVIAVIGNSKARVFNSTIKFDRYSKTPTFKSYSANEKFTETETFTATGRTTVLDLKYPSTLDKSKISLFINDVKQMISAYNITLYTKVSNGFTQLKGRITLNGAPSAGDVLRVVYEKNDEILDNLNRIDKYYKPGLGMPGIDKDIPDDGTEVTSDYSQLMTGIDFGGTIVQGATFDVGAGWDALPWFTEGWDSAEDTSGDFYVAAGDSTHTFTLPSAPEAGKKINIYIRRKGELNGIRLDDPNFGTQSQTNENAIMETFVGDGSTTTIFIPEPDTGISINDGDVIIFRPETSDGSLEIQGQNLIDAEVSGGMLNGLEAYSTALGITPEEIVIDGERFISPDQVPAPEENVPGQVLETLSFRIFHTDRFGSPTTLSKIYIGDGSTQNFIIGQKILENANVLVYVNKIKQVIGTDYTVNAPSNQIRFINAPTSGQIIEVFSMGIGGVELLDFRQFTGDGKTRYFLTGASINETGRVLATVDGVTQFVGFVNSNGLVNQNNNTLVEFGVPPRSGTLISVLVLSEQSGQAESVVKINHEEFTIDSNVRTYTLDSYEPLEASSIGNIIVDLNGKLLRSVDTTYVVYEENIGEITIGTDPFKNFGSIVPTQIRVYINNELQENGTDYIFNGDRNTVEILSNSGVVEGDIVRIEDFSDISFNIENNVITIADRVALADNDKLSVIWFDRYDQVDIIKDIYRGGQQNYKLQRSVLNVGSIWVYKNGERLTPDIDFYLAGKNDVVYISTVTAQSDIIEIIGFSADVYSSPMSFEIFKDNLNRNTYSRYQIKEVTLTKELNYFDTELTVSDASELTSPTVDQFGIVTINGEKIQYLSKDGNVLKNLRRGYLGTSIPSVHNIGSIVIDTGFEEQVPYSDKQTKEDFVSDGSSLIIGPLGFTPRKTEASHWDIDDKTIPDGYGRCDSIEVFVGGTRLRKDLVSLHNPTVGANSPEGDVVQEAQFSVDGTTNYIRLTESVPAGVRITVVRRTGNTWYNIGDGNPSDGQSLSNATTAIARFLQNSSTKLPE